MAAVRRIAIGALVLVVLTASLADDSGAARRRRNRPQKVVDVKVATGYANTEGTPHSFVDLPGATTTVTAAKNGLIVIRFGAESNCFGVTSGYCSVRVLVDGLEASPIRDRPVFDATDDGGSDSRAIERSFDGVAKGPHEVTVQWAAVGGRDMRFHMGAWHLTVESFR